MINFKTINLEDVAAVTRLNLELSKIAEFRLQPQWASDKGKKILDDIEAEARKQLKDLTGEG